MTKNKFMAYKVELYIKKHVIKHIKKGCTPIFFVVI